MEGLMGLINLEHEHDFLEELTYFRCGAAAPFAGRYRLIDFTLSNMVNSGAREVGIFTNKKYRSLMDHLGTGDSWELGHRHGGLFILPPDWNDPSDISKGDLRHFHNNKDYFKRSSANHVVISGSQFISNHDYRQAFRQHLKQGADVTLITTKFEEDRSEHEWIVRVEENDEGKVENLTNDKQNPVAFTGVYIIKKEKLLEIVDECIAYHYDNFFYQGIKNNIEKLNIQTYQNEEYGFFVNNVQSFFYQNLRLLEPDNYQALFNKETRVQTKISNEPPAKYRATAKVSNSLVSNGCEIDGEVNSSILFRGVKVEEGASIKNSIVLQRCTIKKGVHLENVILDKDVTITEDQTFIGSKEKPFTIAKRQTI